MKIAIKFSMLLLVLAAGCKRFDGYTISGKIKNAEGVKIYLEDIGENNPVVIDTTHIEREAFTLQAYSQKGMYRLRFGDDPQNSVFLYIQGKDKIRIETDFKSLKNGTVTGSRPTERLQQVMAKARAAYKLLDSAYFHVKDAPDQQKDSLQKIFAQQKKALVDLVKDFVKNEENAEVACFALNLLGPMMQDEIPYLVNVTEKLHEADPHSKYINTWYASMKQYREAVMNETESGIPVGEAAPNIVLQSPSGDTIQLKNLQGNYVLLDFWASWCGPCRQENPNVVRIYNKFHPMGFEVFSVSLDANKQQWMHAIQKDGLAWKNHGSDFGGWQSTPAQQYRVDAIPATFLIDKKGKIIAKNLHGDALEEKLDELYASQKK
jgi:peroxiredoxin